MVPTTFFHVPEKAKARMGSRMQKANINIMFELQCDAARVRKELSGFLWEGGVVVFPTLQKLLFAENIINIEVFEVLIQLSSLVKNV